jgi:menaquinone-dependent protoporphyrinogen oxidase
LDPWEAARNDAARPEGLSARELWIPTEEAGMTKGGHMAILVAYASKYGATKAYAEAMARELGPQARAIDLGSREGRSLDIGHYEMVIAGSSVYAGRPRRAFKAFISRSGQALATKKTAFFLCGLAKGDETKPIIQAAIPADMADRAMGIGYLPGWIDPEKANAFERFIISMIAKEKAKNGQAPGPEPLPDVGAHAKAFLQTLKS